MRHLLFVPLTAAALLLPVLSTCAQEPNRLELLVKTLDKISAPPVQAPAGLVPVALDTDAFLSELERALNGPQTPELKSLDVLTPHVREIAFDVR